jgi:hypothetical protein
VTTPDPYAVPPPGQPPQQPGQPGQPGQQPPPYGYAQPGQPPQGAAPPGYPPSYPPTYPPSYPPTYPPPGYGYQAPPRKPIDGVSVAALVFGLLGFIGLWVVGIICGIIGVRRTRPDSVQRGRGLAVAGLILSGVWALLWVLGFAAILAFSHSSAGHQVSDVVHGKRALVLSLSRGDCFEYPQGAPDASTYGVFTNVRRQNCSSPHDAEVIVADDIDATIYPGSQSLVDDARARCASAFQAVRQAHPDAALRLVIHVPTEFAWQASGQDSGTARIVCSVRDSRQRTGALLGLGGNGA